MEVDRVTGVMFILGCGVALLIFGLLKYYTKQDAPREEEEEENKKDGMMENIKKAFTLGMYRPGTTLK